MVPEITSVFGPLAGRIKPRDPATGGVEHQGRVKKAPKKHQEKASKKTPKKHQKSIRKAPGGSRSLEKAPEKHQKSTEKGTKIAPKSIRKASKITDFRCFYTV